MPHTGQTTIFTPLRPPFSTSLSLFATIFRAAYQAGFGVYPILSLLAVTSSYGKHTVCLVRTVCTFLYFSYVGGRCQIKRIASVIELSEGFNLSYLTLETDAFKKRSV